jgi:hypothetical protein
MPVESCIPIIPSANLEKSLRLWVDGLGFSMSSEMRKDDKLIFCMLRKHDLCFMLNQRAGTPVKPEDYEGIRLYWAPKDIHKTRERLKSLGYGVSELEHRDYGQTEFFLTDDDGYSHCFGVPTLKIDISRRQSRTAIKKASNRSGTGASHCRKSRRPIACASRHLR